ncbi:septum site-determining protein MinC [Acidithiobacillus sp.]|jgi:septum site-determining protein MinC|uniref:septum site-determining protein MinC n=1 Tax=Acidithiobacillus sp. TaxID=1872118 RepID=UPI0025C14B19|nr:septum site-determining protein MinC [Acidithiobacillus sp.]MCK9188046.1 septum site-determining protein MinC [Acidithiobacillus sp.]MCK9360006.1 septum site-determining protein MinC [Acidithiobacillus sp.]
MANPRSLDTESNAPLRVSGGVFTLSILHLESNNPQQLAQRIAEEHQRHPAAADFHRFAPVVLDLSAIPEEAPLALPEILEVLRTANWLPVGLRNASPGQQALARHLHLPILRGQDRNAAPQPETPPPVQPVPTSPGGLILDHPIRGGQRSYARGGDLVCLAAVNAGAEIMADGNIHVYGPLRGRALAGVNGQNGARIFCMSLEAELVSVTGLYRTLETNHPLWGKAAQIYSRDEQLHITALNI